MLSWTVENANEIDIYPPVGVGKLPTSGSERVYPKITTHYTLSAYNDQSSKTSIVTIDVIRKDQYQETVTDTYLCNLEGSWQSFIPKNSMLTGVCVYIQDVQNSIGSNGITMAIFEESIVNNTNASYSSIDSITSSLPVYDVLESRGSWVYFDLNDVTLNLFKSYVIHLSSTSIGNFYWYGSSKSTYPDGVSHRCREEFNCDWDFSFKTYVSN